MKNIKLKEGKDGFPESTRKYYMNRNWDKDEKGHEGIYRLACEHPYLQPKEFYIKKKYTGKDLELAEEKGIKIGAIMSIPMTLIAAALIQGIVHFDKKISNQEKEKTNLIVENNEPTISNISLEEYISKNQER
ncbi:MAG: hypothetical protein K6F04_00250 [bacterium]|nr:hypothetical protein [bacterium]